MKTYLVGGYVRDQLLGLATKDRDWVVVGSTAEEMLKQDYRQVGKENIMFYKTVAFFFFLCLNNAET